MNIIKTSALPFERLNLTKCNSTSGAISVKSNYFWTMNKEEAKLFFPHEPEDDLDDLWEQRLFEQKQFLLTRPPLAKVFQSRLKKLKQQYHAYLLITNQENRIKSFSSITREYDFSEDLIEAFHTYHENRNDLKSDVLQATDYASLEKVISAWLSLERAYYELWYFQESKAIDLEVTLSKEPDPMVFLGALKTIKEKQKITTFRELQNAFHDLPDMLQKEVKRLTLLSED